ncbi:hypothetical protein B0H17DRAFT_1338563 [Mycena rosella]|uniref:Uncharacterized protein n=1 Tax=Mycena rosella TaxID=1033263 RepID=A0AAD7G3D2_MYCRO|nr:hypothetical protein B0H17DRAFT_1338563 [Mycena rosella]
MARHVGVLATFSLPEELWLEIFEEAVSHTFRALSRGILFRDFKFCPEAMEPRSEGTEFVLEWHKGRELSRHRERQIERANFWSSAEIAPNVRTCVVTLWRIPIVLETLSPLASACVEAISRFTELRELRCILHEPRGVWLEALGVDGLPYLRRLEITGGWLARPSEHLAHSITLTRESRLSYLAVLEPTALRSLNLDARSLSFESSHDTRAMASFHRLHILELAFHHATFTELHAYLSPFPAIRELTLRILARCAADALPAPALTPHPRKYTGPAPTEPAITDIYAPGTRAALQRITGGVPASVASLHVGVQYEYLHLLRDILAFFPHLASLKLDIYLPGTRPPSDFDQFRIVHIFRVGSMWPYFDESFAGSYSQRSKGV